MAAEAITSTDFDLGRAGSAIGTLFGPGLYFAESTLTCKTSYFIDHENLTVGASPDWRAPCPLTGLDIQTARKFSNGRKIARIAPIWMKI